MVTCAAGYLPVLVQGGSVEADSSGSSSPAPTCLVLKVETERGSSVVARCLPGEGWVASEGLVCVPRSQELVFTYGYGLSFDSGLGDIIVNYADMSQDTSVIGSIDLNSSQAYDDAVLDSLNVFSSGVSVVLSDNTPPASGTPTPVSCTPPTVPGIPPPRLPSHHIPLVIPLRLQCYCVKLIAYHPPELSGMHLVQFGHGSLCLYSRGS